MAVLTAAALGMAVTARLGWWQLDRAAQKAAVQASLDERRALPPVPGPDLARTEAEAQAQHHRAAVLHGRWEPDATIYLENRPMQGRAGFLVLTPLLLDDGTAVLVQRGWLPRDPADRTRVQAPPASTEPVQVPGRIAPGPSRLYEFASEQAGPIRQNLDLADHARETGLRLRPWTLVQEQDETATVGPEASAPSLTDPAFAARNAEPARPSEPAALPSARLLRDWPAPATGLAKHHGYAAQWFSLCALIAGLTLWFQFLQPLRQRLAARRRDLPDA
jgi:surfeit locus 1 family protein